MTEVLGSTDGAESGPSLREDALRLGYVSAPEFDRWVRPR